MDSILQCLNDAIIVHDEDGKILNWNMGATRMYGFSEAEALKMNVGKILAEGEHNGWLKRVHAIYGGGQPAEYHGYRLHKDGHKIEVSVSASALPDQDGGLYGIASVERDLTHVRLAETRRRGSAYLLNARLTAAGELAAGLAHELNQPITSIVHFCDVAQSIARGFTPDRAEELIDVLDEAATQSQRAGKIIHNLRRFLGRNETTRSAQSINRIVSDTTELLAAELTNNQISLHLSLAEGLPEVRVDGTQISQVLVNLVKNAIEVMVDTNTAERRIDIHTQPDQNHVHSVRITICDSGPGINEEIAHLMFEPFQTNRPDGLGLGLWISRSIIESHGGRLWADQKRRIGACFHFSLPPSNSEQ